MHQVLTYLTPPSSPGSLKLERKRLEEFLHQHLYLILTLLYIPFVLNRALVGGGGEGVPIL